MATHCNHGVAMNQRSLNLTCSTGSWRPHHLNRCHWLSGCREAQARPPAWHTALHNLPSRAPTASIEHCNTIQPQVVAEVRVQSPGQ